ncbi:hypothetical protein EBU58_01755 [bacterium]|nr:hypothetical protein [bacterium]
MPVFAAVFTARAHTYASSLLPGLPVLAALMLLASPATAGLEADLKARDPATLAAQVRLRGNARRGGILFHTSAASCTRCHTAGDAATPLGPDLATPRPEASTLSDAIEHTISSLLEPSAKIREGYETITIQTVDGEVQSGLRVRENADEVVLRSATNLLEESVIPREDIEAVGKSNVSMMPAGLVDSLGDEQAFFDLVRYVADIAQGGKERQAALQPDPEDLVIVDDTEGLDHAGIELNDAGMRRPTLDDVFLQLTGHKAEEVTA